MDIQDLLCLIEIGYLSAISGMSCFDWLVLNSTEVQLIIRKQMDRLKLLIGGGRIS